MFILRVLDLLDDVGLYFLALEAFRLSICDHRAPDSTFSAELHPLCHLRLRRVMAPVRA